MVREQSVPCLPFSGRCSLQQLVCLVGVDVHQDVIQGVVRCRTNSTQSFSLSLSISRISLRVCRLGLESLGLPGSCLCGR